MGILRLYLALCVVVAHSDSIVPWAVHSGVEAVQIFFVISGFYMALICSKYHGAIEFYTSRFLRIYLPYWIILSVILACSVISGVLFRNWLAIYPYVDYSPEKNGLLGMLVAAISSVTIFFQDWILFLKHDPGESLSFTANFQTAKYPLWNYLLIPPSWSIGIELCFYLLVPWLSKLCNVRILGLIGLAIAARVFCYEVLGLKNDPWTYRFAPFELALFLLGMLSYRIYAQFKDQIKLRIKPDLLSSTPSYLVFSVTLLVGFFGLESATQFGIQWVDKQYGFLFSYVIWAALIPILFELTQKNSCDRAVGELSYPVYLLHFVISRAVSVLLRLQHLPEHWQGEITAVSSIVVAIALTTLIMSPLELKRHRLAKQVADWASKRQTVKQPRRF